MQDQATGRIKFGARYYDPREITWTQQDTQNDPRDPANANRYQYAGNDPINNPDTTGALDVLGSIAAGLGIVAGACSIAAGVLALPIVTLPGAAFAGSCAAITGGAAGILGGIDYFLQ